MANKPRYGSYDWIKKMSASEIGKLDKKQSAELLRKFREKFKMRQKQFARAGKNVYSPALEKMDVFYEEHGMQSTEKMTRNRMQSEIFHIQEFFQSETGEVSGARKVMREQDARIFGVNEKGKPNARMSIEERTRFWQVYDEYMRMHPKNDNPYMSGKIQQYLGEIMLDGRENRVAYKIGKYSLLKAINELQQKIEEGEPEYDSFGFNIFSGRGASK